MRTYLSANLTLKNLQQPSLHKAHILQNWKPQLSFVIKTLLSFMPLLQNIKVP
jgi:hypothetical protein